MSKNKKKHTSKSPMKNTPKKKIKQDNNKIIYLDNNSTTLICEPAIKTYKKWIECYNPATNSSVSQPAKNMIEKSKEYILNHCSTSSKKYKVIFTSGATESNCLILRSVAESYKRLTNNKPHIITSSIEHSSVLDCCSSLLNNDQIELDIIQPNIYGCILPEMIESVIKQNTCLISIMYANNEIGSINNVYEIGKIAHQNKIPMHSDCVQIFGKFPIDLNKLKLDAVSISFHKFYGPKGIGALIVNNDLIEGYKLEAQINGHQQNGLRGGTENVPAIASAIEALKWTFKKRKEKNNKLLKMRNFILDELNKKIPCKDYMSYMTENFPNAIQNSNLTLYQDTNQKNNIEIVILGPPKDKPSYFIPNTILLSIVKNKDDNFCNLLFKKTLDKNGIIVGVGSACLSDLSKASYVLDAIQAPSIIKKGIIRISLGDCNTIEELQKFIKIFFEILNI